jgi:hypothetical protein
LPHPAFRRVSLQCASEDRATQEQPESGHVAPSGRQRGPKARPGSGEDAGSVRLNLSLAIQLLREHLDPFWCVRLAPITSPLLLLKHTRSQGPFLHRHYPASSVLQPCPSSGLTVSLRQRWRRDLHQFRISRNYSDHCLRMLCSIPRWNQPVLSSVLPGLVRPSPILRRVDFHDCTFEACSSFTRVTACGLARPPFADFVMGLQLHSLSAAHQATLNRLLTGWDFHPPAIGAVAAH